MLDPDTVYFPANVITLLTAEIETIDPSTDTPPYEGLRIVKRPLRTTDATKTVSVIAGLWTPDMESLEMQGGIIEPTLQTYTVEIGSLVIDGDEERGMSLSALLSARIRQQLYRSQDLRAALSLLEIPLGGYVEKTDAWGISNQYFQNDRIDRGFSYITVLEFWLRTQTNKQ